MRAVRYATAFVFVSAIAGVCSAAEPLVTYVAPSQCPTGDAFLSTLRSLPPTRGVNLAPLDSVRVRISAEGSRFIGRLIVEERDHTTSTRIIAGAACDDLADTLLFLAALAMGLAVVDPPKITAMRPRPPTLTPTTPKPKARSPWGVFAGANVTVLSMVGPTLRGAMEPFAAVDFGSARYLAPELRLSFTHATSGTITTPVGTATLGIDAVTFAACPIRFVIAGPRFRPCIALQVGAIEGQGYGASLADPHTETRPWLVVALPMRLEWLVARSVELGAEVAPLAPLLAHRFYFGPDTTVYQLPPVGVSLALGVAVRFR